MTTGSFEKQFVAIADGPLPRDMRASGIIGFKASGRISELHAGSRKGALFQQILKAGGQKADVDSTAQGRFSE